MLTTNICPACGERSSTWWPALVSGFIQSYALQDSVPQCRLYECGACGLRYFDRRYEDQELARLYADYRGPLYQRARQAHERGYTAAFNDSLGDDVPARNGALSRFFERHRLQSTEDAVIDYGGDTGKYIPDTFKGPRYVYDISGKLTEPGVERIIDSGELARLKAPFILLAHVLEHAPRPMDLLSEIVAVMAPGARLYVEVPNERPKLDWLSHGKAYQNWVSFAADNREARRWIQAFDSLARRALNHVPPFGLLELHEHINFFHEPSLRALLTRAGFEVSVTESEPGVVRVLARRP